MSEVVTAVYENGILRPAHPLNLREKQQVRIQVWTEEGQDAVEQVIQELINARLLTPPSGHPEGEPMLATERRELAEALGRIPGASLSAIIIEERGR